MPNVCDLLKTIDHLGMSFSIPIYQRQYVWKEKEIHQLMDDFYIAVKDNKDTYYLGTLICLKEENSPVYKVCDGQQRLTTLILLLKALQLRGISGNSYDTLGTVLKFDEGIRSSYNQELRNILNIRTVEEAKDLKQGNTPLTNGFKIICDYLARNGHRDGIKEEELKESYEEIISEGIKKAVLKMDVLPKGTDENHFYITVNKMTLQLEQSDIIKAMIMESFCSSDEANNRNGEVRFNELWQALGDINTHLVRGISFDERTLLFGKYYLNMPTDEHIEDYLKSSEDKKAGDEGPKKLSDILCPSFTPGENKNNPAAANEGRSVGESILTFSYFLAYAISAFLERNELKRNKQINDKELLKYFYQIPKNKFRDFFFFLIRYRFLYDSIVIRRNSLEGMNEGVKRWILLCPKNGASHKGNSDKIQNSITYSQNYRDNQSLIQLQSCLRVNYTSPMYMNWLYDFMFEGYRRFFDGLNEKDEEVTNCFVTNKSSEIMDSLEKFLRSWTREKVKNELEGFDRGTGTPHILFNYLDFLIWEKINNKNWDDARKELGLDHIDFKEKSEAENFEFAFRNSVEHFFPQDPDRSNISPEQSKYIDSWLEISSSGKEERRIDNFGNLCLLSSSHNTSFLNNLPIIKINKARRIVSEGSLKLRIMAAICESNNINTGIGNWTYEVSLKHGEAMKTLLRSDVEELRSVPAELLV